MKAYVVKVKAKDEKPIKIKETKKCDTRTIRAGEKPTKEVARAETEEHISAVNKCARFLASKLLEQCAKHDHTKLDNFDEFYDALCTGYAGKEFKDLAWWEKHLAERHHLNDRCPKDVTLIDVIEMICDCVAAGLARSGEVYDLKLSNEVLKTAFENTAKLLIDNIEVEKADEQNAKERQ